MPQQKTTAPQWFFKRGELTRGPWETVVDHTLPGWEHTGIQVANLTPNTPLELPTAPTERLVVPLNGGCTVTYQTPTESKHTQTLTGRKNVFSGPTDVLYLGTNHSATITSITPARILIATAPTDIPKPAHYMSAAQVPVELRGAGASSRQVHNFGRKEALDAAKFIVVEVITPAENWSSYPPHKHDEHKPGHESQLEEIYYFEVAPSHSAPPHTDPDKAFGLFSTYSSNAGEISIDTQVKTGDVALVPYGYHGPAVAAPGYDMYYLNVMAGPDPERSWLITDDPAHAWVRDTWATQTLDPRLPFGPNN